ncbi:MAG: site-2 protease family protein [Acidobacteria bacterium]|nr:site-2 protease family protein [Acidobacteriota bacterium]
MSTEYRPAPLQPSELQWADPASVSSEIPCGEWPSRRFHHRYWLHALLLLITLVTTTAAGGLHYASFLSDFGARALATGELLSYIWPQGLWYSGTLLLILGAHEMGHYLACRYHQVDATLPYFLPAPLPLTGTIGAFIRIREAFPNRRILFDIGVAGPLAGFAVLVPALFAGLAMSTIAPLPADFSGLALGEPLLFRAAARIVWGAVPDGYSINMHPMVFASWFGLFATALNLMPFGQLDGGHISYAALGRRSTIISLVTIAVAVGLTFVSSSWMVVTVMMVLMLLAFGAKHPSVIDDAIELDPPRRAVALFSAVVFVVCFTPVPIEPLELLR